VPWAVDAEQQLCNISPPNSDKIWHHRTVESCRYLRVLPQSLDLACHHTDSALFITSFPSYFPYHWTAQSWLSLCQTGCSCAESENDLFGDDNVWNSFSELSPLSSFLFFLPHKTQPRLPKCSVLRLSGNGRKSPKFGPTCHVVCKVQNQDTWQSITNTC